MVRNPKADALTITVSEISENIVLQSEWNLVGVPSKGTSQLDQLPTDAIVTNFNNFHIRGNTESKTFFLVAEKAYFAKK